MLNDKKLGVTSNNSTVDYFNPQVVSAQDYYPFGMLQPGRSYNVGGYRYGFNGKENDLEVKGDGNQYDYGFRIYDPRVGRFLSVDPLFKGYPWYTPYQFAWNKPIIAIDLDGLEDVEVYDLIGYWTDKKLQNQAAGLAQTNPMALAVIQQINRDAVIVGIEDIVRMFQRNCFCRRRESY